MEDSIESPLQDKPFPQYASTHNLPTIFCKPATFIALRNLKQERASRSHSNKKMGHMANPSLKKLNETAKEWEKVKHNLNEGTNNSTTSDELEKFPKRRRTVGPETKARSASREKLIAALFSKNVASEDVEDDEGEHINKNILHLFPVLKYKKTKAGEMNNDDSHNRNSENIQSVSPSKIFSHLHNKLDTYCY